ncbi:MAG: PAS domain S-box protein [Anaerolineae bacterium]|nr:PAS domain S-box protein [Anaerolineae bacterium]
MRITDFISSLKAEWMATPSLQNARSQLLRGMMVAFAIFGFPAMLVGSIEAFSQGHPATSLLYLGLYLPILFAAIFPRHLSFRRQSRILLGLLYLLAFSNLLTYGFSGAGIHILLTICVLTTLLLDGRAGAIGIGMSLMVIAVAAYALSTSRIEIDPELLNTSGSPIAWATAAVTFLMLSVAIVVTIGLVQGFLQRSLQAVQEHRRQLQESESRYRLLAETANDLIITHDMDGRITYANSTALRLSGFGQEQLHLKSLTDLIPQEFRQAARGRRDRLLEGTHQRLIFETQFVAESGQSVPIEVNASLIRDKQEVTGILMIARDITERKRAEEELRMYRDHLEELVAERTQELENAKERLVRHERLAVLGQLAGGLGHELRNPLGAIKNATYFLNMALEDPEPTVKEALDILDSEVNTSEAIIRSLFDYARPKPVVPRKVDLAEVIGKVLERVGVPENVGMEVIAGEDLPIIYADPDQLNQVFDNVIRNAIQAMPEGGRLLVEAAGSDGGESAGMPEWVTISVTDTGVGIPEENLARMFEPLFTTKAQRIGLGLAVTKLLVEGHGGTIGVASAAGEGSTFTVKLPVGM